MAERNVLLKSLKHPFLVRLHYSFQTPEKLYFVLDYVNGGEVCLWNWKKKIHIIMHVIHSNQLEFIRLHCSAAIKCVYLFTHPIFAPSNHHKFCYVGSCSSTCKGNGVSQSPEPGSTLLRSPALSATFTLSTLFIGQTNTALIYWKCNTVFGDSERKLNNHLL